uniref:Amino acid transporter n=1 Tax=Phallusia mammillata TaxID=59560 RepID=A0A6F9DSM9_9ASCI|nr:excitatory amino acid transporter 3-like [Phallusia mammillata]
MANCRACSPAKIGEKLKNKQNLQVLLTLVGVAAGIALGFGLRAANLSQEQLRYVALPGTLFLRALNSMVIPVIVSSIICGFAALKGTSKGKILLKTMVYYIMTTFLAAITGVLLCLALKPGVGINASDVNVTSSEAKAKLISASPNAMDALHDMLMNLVPENVFKATMYKYKTERVSLDDINMQLKGFNTSSNTTLLSELKNVAKSQQLEGPNYMGLISLGIIFGCVLGNMGAEGRVIIDFSSEVFKLTTRIILYLMWLAPVGLAFLIAPNIIKVENLEDTIEKLGIYLVTVIMGFSVHLLFSLSLIYFIIVRKNPFIFFAGMSQALLTMLGTASSSVTLPVTMKCVEENNKVDKRITSFLLPIGATINMDGTALYEAVSAIFIAQLNGYPTDFGTLVTISFTATAASIGTAGVPMSSLITILIVLQACGLPTTDWYLLLSVDWILSRGQGLINILGDSVGAAVIEKLSRDDLIPSSAQENEEEEENLYKTNYDKNLV